MNSSLSGSKSPNKRKTNMKPQRQPPVVPAEDNWNLVANPSVYLDVLPQPYRFINKCLDNLIMKPVFN